MEEKIYSTYTEAQKRATQKYRSNNKEKINIQRKIYYEKRKNSDKNFLLYKRQKAKEYYKKKIQNKKPKIESDDNELTLTDINSMEKEIMDLMDKYEK